MDIPPYIDLLGVPFKRGGRGPRAYDCYGLIMELYRRRGIELPDFQSPGSLEAVESIMRVGLKAWTRTEPEKPGSLITFRVEGLGAHVGMMLTDDRFIHAIEGPGVTTERFSNPLFKPLAFYDYV